MINFPDAEFEPIVSAIAKISATKTGPILIAIDGPAGSGKTSLANQLSNKLNSVTTIHMDDLYKGWEDALTATLTQHLKEWIIDPFGKHQSVLYQKFNWSTGEYGLAVEARDIQLLILEGVGAAQEIIRQSADLTIWIEVGERWKHRISCWLSSWWQKEPNVMGPICNCFSRIQGIPKIRS